MSTLGLLSGARSQHAQLQPTQHWFITSRVPHLLDVVLPSGGRACVYTAAQHETTLAHKHKYDVMSRTHPRTPEGVQCTL